MQIDGLGERLSLPGEKKTEKTDGVPFGEVLNGFFTSVNADQLESQRLTEEFINGGKVEIHDVMIAGEKAKTSLELLMEIRNKTLDMYRELTRMQ